ncbi:MAG: succinate dehydrogenase/fumarate reductase flavoprotein subunit, partial [Proteobacteria bacterium]|nr:succinate dehydrogenase/fumarate reductase flavoprotein subunit [Pseudomonadota bacterium]
MPYTPEMKELIKRVEATRAERIERTRRGEYFKPMTLDERADVLKKFHPDYMDEGRRAVKLGPNKGDVYP